MIVQRRFAIIGHKTPSTGTAISLNDLPGLSGRLDVLARAINSTLFLSHGIRKNSQITLHLMGGEGPPRRVVFDGAELGGVRSDERSISGHIRTLVKSRLPPIGIWEKVSSGIYHSGGDLETTMKEWKEEGVDISVLDKEGRIMDKETLKGDIIGFILSDDLPFDEHEREIISGYKKVSIGKKWLQGHSCIAIIHHIIDAIEVN
mgnify:FL=1|jgi:tRNA (pseudouridine54-N1)-methyltransferase